MSMPHYMIREKEKCQNGSVFVIYNYICDYCKYFGLHVSKVYSKLTICVVGVKVFDGHGGKGAYLFIDSL